MKSRVLTVVALLAVVSGLVAVGLRALPARAASITCMGIDPITCTGSDLGAAFLMERPAAWNGTLVLYSHGYVAPGSKNPATDVGDPLTRSWLLANGYALAGSSYSTTGWAVQQALTDQVDVLNIFAQQFGAPKQTIAWGHSLGGMITAGLIQLYPQRFSAALPMCGVVAGGVGTWNQALDSTFAFKLLLDSNQVLQLVHITNPNGNLVDAQQILAAAQSTPQGRARIALSAALGDLPGWFSATSPEPAATDFSAQEANQFLWDQQVDFPFVFALRAELEARAGGNPSWNTGVDYRVQLSHSTDLAEVKALYQQAGLSLDADLAALQDAPRISADPGAVKYLSQYVTYDGQFDMPVLTMHTTGDGLVVNTDESAYASVVRSSGNNSLLREVFVHRAGHCTFTPAETIAAFQTLVHRLNTGCWEDSTNPDVLNAKATSLGSTFNTAPASFLTYQPAQFLRPFDAGGHGNAGGGGNA